MITTDFVTIDLAGFTISGPPNTGTGIGVARSIGPGLQGTAVRNGSISGFIAAVDLGAGSGPSSIVEGLRVSRAEGTGIVASGIVKGNTVTESNTGIIATGTVTGNYAARNRSVGIDVGPGSTVIGNTATDNLRFGLTVGCPSNLTDNMAVNNGTNLELFFEGCHTEDNLAP